MSYLPLTLILGPSSRFSAPLSKNLNWHVMFLFHIVKNQCQQLKVADGLVAKSSQFIGIEVQR